MSIKSYAITCLFSILICSCAEKVSTPLDLALEFERQQLSYRSLSYDIDYMIKFYSQVDDTSKVKATIDLIRDTTDTIFGGHIWIEGESDSIARYYDTEFLYFIQHNKQSITKYPKEKSYPITGHISGDATTIYFLKPGRLVNGARNDSTTFKELKKTTSDQKDTWEWKYIFETGNENHTMWKKIWIDEEKLDVLKMIFYSHADGEDQYNQWDISGLKYDQITEEQLKDRLNALLETYSMEDYKEPTEEERAPLALGTSFPEISGLTYKSEDSVTLENYQDKVLLLDFWYMDCPPCINSIEHLNELQKKYADKNFTVLGINPYDNTEKNLKRLPNFLSYHPIDYPIVFIDRNYPRESYAVHAFPTMYLLNKSGEVIYSKVGFGDEMPPEVDSLIQLNL